MIIYSEIGYSEFISVLTAYIAPWIQFEFPITYASHFTKILKTASTPFYKVKS